jgi:trehalose 6-phosphate phosphatase
VTPLEAVIGRCADVLRRSPAGLMTDFDGTLSPIVERPEEAQLLPAAGLALARLVRQLDLVAVVSGRPVADLVDQVALPGVALVGNHGAERWRDGVALVPAPSPEEAAALGTAEGLLREALACASGVRFERKTLGFAVHYREAPTPTAVRSRVLRLAGHLARLGVAAREGKRVLEIRPLRAPTKGGAVEWLIEEHGLRGLVFVGDDHTDVDAFRALQARRGRGELAAVGVAVLGSETPAVVREAADLAVDGPEAVADLLAALADRRVGARPAEWADAVDASTSRLDPSPAGSEPPLG